MVQRCRITPQRYVQKKREFEAKQRNDRMNKPTKGKQKLVGSNFISATLKWHSLILAGAFFSFFFISVSVLSICRIGSMSLSVHLFVCAKVHMASENIVINKVSVTVHINTIICRIRTLKCLFNE